MISSYLFVSIVLVQIVVFIGMNPLIQYMYKIDVR